MEYEILSKIIFRNVGDGWEKGEAGLELQVLKREHTGDGKKPEKNFDGKNLNICIKYHKFDNNL